MRKKEESLFLSVSYHKRPTFLYLQEVAHSPTLIIVHSSQSIAPQPDSMKDQASGRLHQCAARVTLLLIDIPSHVPAEKKASHKACLFVAQIPRDCDEDSLREHFAPYGEIVSVKLLKDRTVGRPYAFVQYQVGDNNVFFCALAMLIKFVMPPGDNRRKKMRRRPCSRRREAR